MGDVDDGKAEALLELPDLRADAPPELGVEVRERLVEQQHAGLEHERAGHRHALLLPARKLAGQAIVQARQAEKSQPFAIDYAPLLAVLKSAGYAGWLVVEAEQDPAVAHPATYARLGFDYLRRAADADASDA